MAYVGSGTPILGAPTMTADQMRQYVRSVNPSAPDYAELYLSIGRRYHVRGDLAFAQSILETNYWRFGGSVNASQNNFAGLGSTSRTEAGASFPTPELGIEAQIQHLYGYATAAPLPAGTTLVDPRFSILQSAGLRGTAPNWEDLNGKWAVPGTTYGQDILRIGEQMQAISTGSAPTAPVTDWKQEAMQWLSRQGLINQPHDPDAPLTWAEFGTVLRRLTGGGQ
ncbi:glucosaminidase domain-containing protein [Paenibacillus chartarius]|uniref:Glucosaminidase domain-containing protein n=1 Tax=Paenibacillus chartarius TaxID=747481 RepID=A0ABV6DV63_9BACL